MVAATILLSQTVMEHIARLTSAIVRKLFKKKNHRRSIGGGEGIWMDNSTNEKKETEEEEEMNEVTPPPLSPGHSRALDYLRVSTPAKTNGILVHEGGPSESGEEEDDVSQAEDCYAWNESIHSVQVDSPEQYYIDGGDDSSSVVSEHGTVEEKKDLGGEDLPLQNEFIFNDEYNEEGFNDVALLQSSFPIQSKGEEKYFFHPTVLQEDEEGYFWEEPMGYSNPSLAPSIPLSLACPNLCVYNEEDLGTLAQSLIEEDKKIQKQENVTTDNKTYAISSSPSVLPSRPGTPTTNEMISPICPNISDGSTSSSSSGTTETIFNRTKGEIFRPECAKDEDNAWLRMLYEKAGLTDEIPDWMRIDPPSQKMYVSEDSSLFDYSVEESQGETKVAGKGPTVTSTPVVGATCNLPFSSISTIGHLNDSNRFMSPSLDGSLIIRGERFAIDVGVRATVALARPFNDVCQFSFDVDVDE